jgi:hypothetical protein
MSDSTFTATLAVFAVVVAVALFLSQWLAARRKKRAALRDLERTWGQPLRSDRDDRPVEALTPRHPPAGCHRLDAPTWSDLDMPRVFRRVDRTLTSVGAQVLHRMLRCPVMEMSLLARRRVLVSAVAADPAARVVMQRALLELGDRQGWHAALALSGALPVLPGPVWLLRLIPLTMVATLGAALLLDHAVLLVSGLTLAFALPFVHLLANRRIAPYLEAVADVRRVLVTADALRKAMPAGVREQIGGALEGLGALRRAFGQGANPTSGRFGGSRELAAEYGRAFALTELVAYQRATRAIASRGEEYERVLECVGEIDAALSIAYLKQHESGLVDAEVTPTTTGLVADGLRHPLVDDAVGNDVELGARGLLVTGSNMAGKSTLLRAIAIDTVLAQSIGLVAADRWSSRPLRVATAMGAHDDLAAGVSLFRAEVDRIHALVDSADGNHLFVLDEAFRGTNPHERIAASAAVLQRLASADLVVAATHDRELCELVEDRFALAYFTEEVVDDDVSFDYRLRPGVLQTTNAIALLERAGFPAALVAEARRIAAVERPDASRSAADERLAT